MHELLSTRKNTTTDYMDYKDISMKEIMINDDNSFPKKAV